MKRDYIYKDSSPVATVERIRKILDDLDVKVLIGSRTNNVGMLHSCALTLEGLPYGTFGKSYTRDFAEASAHGELMERLQNQLFYRHVEFSPATRAAGGFSRDPKEKKVSGTAIPGLPDDFRHARIEEGRTNLHALWRRHRCQLRERGLSVTLLPFYNVRDKKVSYLPSEFITDFFGSNGMCAGNTPAEALDQGLSEICERYVQRELYVKELTPPDVPDTYLSRHAPAQFEMIEQLRKAGGYMISVKDCSLGKKFPVVGVLFFQPETGHYWFSLGASPVWQVALERCLTEAFQGFSIGDSWKMRPVNLLPPFSQKSDKLGNYVNYVNLMCTEVGYYPPALFKPAPSYRFNGFNLHDFKTQKEKVDFLLSLIRGTGRNVYIRDASILGWPAYSIISPGISEVLYYSPCDWNEVQTSYSRLGAMTGIDKLSRKKLGELVADMAGFLMSTLPLYSRNGAVPFISLANYLRVPGHERLPWHKASLQLICALLYGYLGDWTRAHEMTEKYVSDMEKVFAGKPEHRRYWMRAVIARDWFGLRASGVSSTEAGSRLERAYGTAAFGLLESLRAGGSPSVLLGAWFPGMQLPRCWDCANCSFKKDCRYGKLEKLHLKIKKAAADSDIDQMRVGRILAGEKD